VGDDGAALYGEGYGFSGLAEEMRPCEGGFVLSAYFVGGDFGAEEAKGEVLRRAGPVSGSYTPKRRLREPVGSAAMG